jgi:drug/metabolite transporter (DMT)-like permease
MGEVYALASALCFGASNVTIMLGLRRGADDNGAFLSLLLTAGLSALGWLGLGLTRGFAPVTPRGLLWLAAAGVFTAFIGRVFVYASIQHLGAIRASAVKRLSPFFSVLLGLAVLGETLSADMAWGCALIVASFAVLVQAQWRADASTADAAGSAGPARAAARLGYLYGTVSAFGYALGYLMRKSGLEETPDPLLGAMVGTLVGAMLFVVAGNFSGSYRRAVRATFRRPNPWLYAAGVLGSLGQILYFAALNVSTMSKAALLVSMEVFVTIVLSQLVLGERVTPRVALAALLGFGGTALLV